MKFSQLLVFGLLAALCGCVKYSYEGTTAPAPTESVQLFASAGAIRRPYTVMGQATVSGNSQDVSRDRLVKKLVSEAEKCGADAILIVEQQVIPEETMQNAAPRFQTAFDYDNSSSNWSQLYRDVDVNYGNIRHRENNSPGQVTVYRRVLRAEFLKYADGKTPASAPAPAPAAPAAK